MHAADIASSEKQDGKLQLEFCEAKKRKIFALFHALRVFK